MKNVEYFCDECINPMKYPQIVLKWNSGLSSEMEEKDFCKRACALKWLESHVIADLPFY